MLFTVGRLDPPLGNVRLRVVQLFSTLLQSQNVKVHREIIHHRTCAVLLVSYSSWHVSGDYGVDTILMSQLKAIYFVGFCLHMIFVILIISYSFLFFFFILQICFLFCFRIYFFSILGTIFYTHMWREVSQLLCHVPLPYRWTPMMTQDSPMTASL